MMMNVMTSAIGGSADVLDAYPGHMMDGWDVWAYWPWILAAWLLMLVIAVLVYMDAGRRDMSALLWAVLVLVPFAGLLFLAIYLVARDDRYQYEMSRKSPEALLTERYARGDITRDEDRRMMECVREVEEA